ncbi:MAG TPA: hypothetical protein VGI23_07010 [Steroidobacteraceae bacterium]
MAAEFNTNIVPLLDADWREQEFEDSGALEACGAKSLKTLPKVPDWKPDLLSGTHDSLFSVTI